MFCVQAYIINPVTCERIAADHLGPCAIESRWSSDHCHFEFTEITIRAEKNGALGTADLR